jgi:hypothetical protein
MEKRGGRIADHDHAAFKIRPPQFERGGGTRIAERTSAFRYGWIVERADHAIVCRQPRARDAFGDHACIAENGGAAA